jgi:hypothetical protein
MNEINEVVNIHSDRLETKKLKKEALYALQ